MYESSSILAINSFSEVFEIQFLSSDSAQAIKDLRHFLDQHEIPFPQILHMNQAKAGCQILITAASENLRALESALKTTSQFKLENPIWSSVTATCTGVASGDLTEKILAQLQKEKISVQKLLQTAMSTTVIVEKSQREKSIQALHHLIG
jgi:aspartokinase